MKTAQVSDKVIVGGQPTEEDLTRLREQGITTVINLRTVGEFNQPLLPKREEGIARDMGLDYRHIPVSLAVLDPAQVEEVRSAIQASEGPVYLHCGAGQRACAFGLLAEGPGDFQKIMGVAEVSGFPVVDPQLKAFIERIASGEDK